LRQSQTWIGEYRQQVPILPQYAWEDLLVSDLLVMDFNYSKAFVYFHDHIPQRLILSLQFASVSVRVL
jgi:hypothetical protein